MKTVLVFAGVLTLVSASPMLADWTAGSIGANSQALIETKGATTFSLTAQGSPLADKSDAIGFAFGPGKLSGDCEMMVHLTKMVSGHQEWAAGGVIMRETLGGDSKFIALGCTHDHGVQSFVRNESSGSVLQQESCPDCNPPVWLKIVRRGNHFTGYKSADGRVWLQIYENDLPMKKNAWVGAFATSGGGLPVATVTFEHVTAREIAP